MRRGAVAGRTVMVLLATSLMLLTAPAASGQDTTGGDAQVRFLHAVPAADRAQLTVSGTTLGAVGFGEATDPVSVAAGDARLTISVGRSGGAATTRTLAPGTGYTAIALREGEGFTVRVYREREARPGAALVRALNAAPELGEPTVRAGDRVLAERLGYGDATDYAELAPGTYPIVAAAPRTGDTVAEEEGVALTAGTTATAVLVGTAGEPLRIVVLEDEGFAPQSAPDTGLGGIGGGGTPWAMALVAALVAGALGALGYVLSGRRVRRG